MKGFFPKVLSISDRTAGLSDASKLVAVIRDTVAVQKI